MIERQSDIIACMLFNENVPSNHDKFGALGRKKGFIFEHF